ncbi:MULTISPECIES: hypothetical protein [Halomonas]|uniref:hypothetical protein n=1 Tax=Halomonas TaxID=2745 RepID=UPI001C955344|nr:MULTISPECIES: hypothetical protein [Halomonas]MBY6209085.1 hypothetical protein [Halomonas sp. DP3Y7-2]MBY6229241.1 hypothetical protein [Halomonas sp. DP3Y7-1]MCA0917696.1 hypothetical protein [Halomonas denitrificans]
MDLLKMIEDAETKDELEAIGKEHLGTDVDKRKGIETIRAALEELAVESADEEPQAAEPAAEAKPEPATAPVKPKGKGETRLLKNTKNGRVVAYTAALAKVKHMKEV